MRILFAPGGMARTAGNDLPVAGIYFIMYPFIAVAGIVATGGAITLANAYVRFGSTLFGIALNVVPPVSVGWVSYYFAARWIRSGGPPVSTWHALRAIPLYLWTVVLGGIVFYGMTEPGSGFGLVAQLFVWPALVAVGGIAGDLLGWRPRRIGRRWADDASRQRLVVTPVAPDQRG